jgi:hypothetical protein
MRRLLFAALIAWPAVASPLAIADYERQLIPVTVVLARGTFDTVWLSRITAVYEGESVTVVGPEYLGLVWNFGKSQPMPLFPLPSTNEPPGSIFYIPKTAVAQTHLSARIYRLDSRTNQTIEQLPMPVVPEAQFDAHTLYFSGLKNDSAERVHLRVYSLDLEHFDPRVRVRVQSSLPGGPPPNSSWAFRYDGVYWLSVEQKYVEYEGQFFPRRPLALELSLDRILSSIPAGSDLAISVVPLASDFRIWAMVSETNNVTQRVRLQLSQ